MPRLGSRVRIPSPAPVSLRKIKYLYCAFGGAFCFHFARMESMEAEWKHPGESRRIPRRDPGAFNGPCGIQFSSPIRPANFSGLWLRGLMRPRKFGARYLMIFIEPLQRFSVTIHHWPLFANGRQRARLTHTCPSIALSATSALRPHLRPSGVNREQPKAGETYSASVTTNK